LIKQFEILFGNRFVAILCPEGELFRVPQAEERTGEYLRYVARAGEEYIKQGVFSGDTRKKLDESLFIMTNRIISAVWGVAYLVSCVGIWAIMHSYYARLVGLANMACPLAAGIFTAFFSRHFPAFVTVHGGILYKIVKHGKNRVWKGKIHTN
jgi:hypothetical protein